MSAKPVLSILKIVAFATFIMVNMLLAFSIYYMFSTSGWTDMYFIVWMVALPLLAIIGMIGAPIFWFFLVPGIARRLTMARFRPGSLQCITSHTGLTDIVQSRFEIPEGAIRNKYGWFGLPRPSYKPLEGMPKEDEDKIVKANSIILKKCILKDVGKPIWFGVSDQVAMANAQTLSALEEKNSLNPAVQITNLRDFSTKLRRNLQPDLKRLVDELEAHLHVEPTTYFDPRVIREVFPLNFQQSLLEGIGWNREQFGRGMQGRDTFKIAILVLVFAVAVIAIIGVLWFLTGGF